MPAPTRFTDEISAATSLYQEQCDHRESKNRDQDGDRREAPMASPCGLARSGSASSVIRNTRTTPRRTSW